jgi:hypothetical protein
MDPWAHSFSGLQSGAQRLAQQAGHMAQWRWSVVCAQIGLADVSQIAAGHAAFQ